MKISILTAAIVAALSAPVAWAEDMPMGGKPMADKPATAAAPAAPGMNMGTDQPAGPSQASMDKMHQQMDKIMSTSDPKARQKLMQEHMQTMQDNMKAMRRMSSMKSNDQQKRQDMTDKRMDMMQDMMEQMMQRDKAAAPMGGHM